MLKKVQKLVMAIAALGAIGVGSAVIADAASNGGTTGQEGIQARTPPLRPDETLLTGDTADKVRQAALDKVPGATVLRVESDAQGSPYEVHLRKADGILVTVKVDKDFKATAVQRLLGPFGRGGPGCAGPGPGGAGPGGAGPGGPGDGEPPLTGDTADKVRQAALDKVPGATVLRVERDAQGSPYEAHLRKSDGTPVTVKVDKDFKATAVEQFGPPGFGR